MRTSWTGQTCRTWRKPVKKKRVKGRQPFPELLTAKLLTLN